MRALLAFAALYHAVSGRFSWLDDQTSVSNDNTPNFDDIFANILKDFNLDISFNQPREPIDAMFPSSDVAAPEITIETTAATDDTADEPFVDDAPSSMFSSFPSLFRTPLLNLHRFRSPFDDYYPSSPQQPTPITPYQQPSSKPLYLMIGNVQKPQKMQSVFTLQRSGKVGGNTYRYTVNSNGNDHSFVTHSWSTMPKTYYLCNNRLCDDKNMEMKNIFDDLGELRAENNRPRMHLVPTSTMQPMEDMIDFINDEQEQGQDYPYVSWLDTFKNSMHGCKHKMQSWYYGDADDVGMMAGNNEEEMPEEVDVGVDYIIYDEADDDDADATVYELPDTEQHAVSVLMTVSLLVSILMVITIMRRRVRKWRSLRRRCGISAEGVQETSTTTAGAYVATVETDKF